VSREAALLAALSAPPSGPDHPPTRPRIVFLVTLAETGGAQTYVASLLVPLRRDFDVVVAAHGSGPLEDATRAAGARFIPLRHVRRTVKPVRDLLGLLELLRLLRRERPQIVHVNSAKAAALGRVAAWFARVPLRVYTVHGWAFLAYEGAASAAYRWVERALRPLTTVTICVSENERRAGLAARACAEATTVVIRNGVDSTAPEPDRPPEGEPRVVMVGRLQAPKDPLTLVRALATLQGRDVEALLVGDGPDRAAVEKEVRRLELESVRLLGQRNDVAELLRTAAIFVLSTRSEGLPLSILEAMAVGLPVIASNVGGVPELVVDGETGVLVPPGDPHSLAGAIERLLGNPALLRQLGEAGRARVREHFDLAAVRQAHLDLYSDLLATGGVRRPSP
jgi:glycosyltransferase involved in cell wall biosynthesis